MFLTAVAAQTRNVRLMTGCLLPVFHHPIQLAAEIALADTLSGGRLDVGFARAFLPNEFEAFGLPLDESRERFERSIEAMLSLWCEDRVTVRDKFFCFEGVRSPIKPVQLPHPPIWGAAARSRESFASHGEQGFNLLTAFTIQTADQLAEQIQIYRESFRPRAYWPNERGRVAMLVPMYLAETDEIAQREGDGFLRHYHKVWAQASKSWDHKPSSAYPGYTDMSKVIQGVSPAAMRQSGSLVFYSPEHAVDHIHWMRERFAVDQILWNLDFGAMPLENARRTLQLFIERVLPAFATNCECGATVQQNRLAENYMVD
jgi:alkanesulfonate monooxygenase SsuD/methylene tetrahydromethanopterin reductase-like flavin-dependent oxidoreductase (luciferase family)